MSSRQLVVVTAGVSQPSSTRLLGDRLATATVAALSAHEVEMRVASFDLRDYAHEITNATLTGFPDATLRPVIDAVRGADAIVVVSPIFNASYSGLFKSFVDVLEEDALRYKPVLIAATGGTERHSLALEYALRPLFAHLRAYVVPTAVYAAASDWGAPAAGAGQDALADRIERAAHELADQVTRVPVAPPADPFADVVPFERLLVGE
jgi:FMN reductase